MWACLSLSTVWTLGSHDNLIHQLVLLLPRLLHLLVSDPQWALAGQSHGVPRHIVLARAWIRQVIRRNIPNSLRIGHREHTAVFKHGGRAKWHNALVPALFGLIVLIFICARPRLERLVAHEVLIDKPVFGIAFPDAFHYLY